MREQLEHHRKCISPHTLHAHWSMVNAVVCPIVAVTEMDDTSAADCGHMCLHHDSANASVRSAWVSVILLDEIE